MKRHREPSSVGEVDRGLGAGGAQHPQPRTQLKPCDAQALGLSIEHSALGLPLRRELTLEVFEQAIPVHPTERRGHLGPTYELSTFVPRTPMVLCARVLD